MFKEYFVLWVYKFINIWIIIVENFIFFDFKFVVYDNKENFDIEFLFRYFFFLFFLVVNLFDVLFFRFKELVKFVEDFFDLGNLL